jgi:hypothetical protein
MQGQRLPPSNHNTNESRGGHAHLPDQTRRPCLVARLENAIDSNFRTAGRNRPDKQRDGRATLARFSYRRYLTARAHQTNRPWRERWPWRLGRGNHDRSLLEGIDQVMGAPAKPPSYHWSRSVVRCPLKRSMCEDVCGISCCNRSRRRRLNWLYSSPPPWSHGRDHPRRQ